MDNNYSYNPFYFSFLLYIGILILIIYSFDNTISVCNHIKFFIYSYLFLTSGVMLMSQYYIKTTLEDYKLVHSNETFKDIVN